MPESQSKPSWGNLTLSVALALVVGVLLGIISTMALSGPKEQTRDVPVPTIIMVKPSTCNASAPRSGETTVVLVAGGGC